MWTKLLPASLCLVFVSACEHLASNLLGTEARESSILSIDPKDTEDWSVIPTQLGFGAQGVPSDALILFDGTSLDAWTGTPEALPGWTVSNSVLTVKPGTGPITSKETFCDAQFHIEWRAPLEGKEGGSGQNWGNSGVFIQQRYELQILNSFENETYANGQAASIYKQHRPLVNASKPAGEWQVYDIIFTSPKFADDGDLISPGYMTAIHNGVLVQNHSELKGPTLFRGQPKYEAHGCAPLLLQDHGDAVAFRNIWARKLPSQ